MNKKYLRKWAGHLRVDITALFGRAHQYYVVKKEWTQPQLPSPEMPLCYELEEILSLHFQLF